MKVSEKELWLLLRKAEFVIASNICCFDEKSHEAKAARRWLTQFAKLKERGLKKRRR